jgi:4-cresol dehydrogenase (hydroxylating)
MASAAALAWLSALGPAFASTDAATLSRYATATFATSQRIVAVLRPGNADEAVACFRIANEHRIPIYPVSGGRNWGLGSRVPASDGNAVLDLGRLKRITDFDERLGYVRVEAGVTFRELHAFLVSRGSELFLPAIGGPADASIVGNCVERGDATGPRADRLANLCDLDVLLPSGERVRTGFGRFAGSPLAPLSNRPPGPQIDGLFTQSNLGVVLAATVWLTPRPAVLQVFTGRVGSLTELPGLVDSLQRLVMRNVLSEHSVSLWNTYKILPRLGRYPWQVTDGKTPLTLRKMGRAEPWFFCGATYSPSPAIAAAERELIATALAPHVASLDFTDSGSNPELWTKAGTFVGAPTDENALTVYWRKDGPRPAALDPDKDRCGVRWICLAMPFDGALVAAAAAMIEDTVPRAGFEPIVGLECTNARSLHAFVAIYYDRDVPGEDERASACEKAVLNAAEESGIHPYRLGIQSMDRMGTAADGYGSLVLAIKSALDPRRVLAPGRYDFRGADRT